METIETTATRRGAASMGASDLDPNRSEATLHGRRVLACLDRSAFSEVCVPYAVSLAKTFGSAMTLVHVMDSHHEHSAPRAHDAVSWEIARQEAQAYLEKLGKVASDSLGRPVDVRIEQGHAADRIVALAEEIGANLTVVGSHGEGGIMPWTLGSTVQQLLAVARTSVFVAHSASDSATTGTLKRILVPLDGSLRSESVLPAVAHMARANGAEISLVHVVQEPIVTALLDAPEDLALAQDLVRRLETAANLYLDHIQERLVHEGTTANTVVLRHANERQGLLEIAKREQADLIVLSAHGAACDPARSFGGVTTYFLSHSLVPLLAIQDIPQEDIQRTRSLESSVSLPPRPTGFQSESEQWL